MNHTSDECYFKHDFSPWMRQRSNHIFDAIEINDEYVIEKVRTPQN